MSGVKSSNYSLPIKVGILYSIFTVILYIWGPYDFPTHNRLMLYLFLFVCNVAIYLGFNQGIFSYRPTPQNCKHVFNIDKFLNILFVIALLTCVPRFIVSTGIRSNILSTIIVRITTYSELAQEYYSERQELAAVTGIWKYINILLVLTGPFSWAYIPLSMLYWGKLGFWKKIASVFIWLTYVAQYLSTGTNVGVFNFIVTLGVVYWIKVSSNSGRKRRSRSARLRVIVIIVAAVVGFLAFFNLTMSSRKGTLYTRENSAYICGQECPINQNKFLYQITPEGLRPLLISVTSYMSRPYGALSYAFDMPFKPTFGVGYSWFLLDNVPFSKDLWEMTYPKQLEKQYSYSSWVNWHTAYTWFANDVSWLGVPFVLFFLMLIFGQAWRRFRDEGDIFSFLLFMLFVRFMLFISMNNQVFQQSDTFLAFWLLLIARLVYKPYKWV